MKQPKINNQKYAVGYCRYSSDNQRDESITAQKRNIENEAQKDGKIIIDWYIDRAMTGTNADRVEWERLKTDSKHRRFGIVYVDKLDRFSRQDYADQRNEEKHLVTNGVRLLTVSEKFENNSTGRLAKGVKSVINSWYSDNLSEEVIKGMKENVFGGKSNGGIAPYGYKAEPIREPNGDFKLNAKGRVMREIAVDPKQAEAVKIMYDMTLKGHKRYEIINRLNSNGYKRTVYCGEKGRRKSEIKDFTEAGTLIDHILRNPKYAGIYEMRFGKKNNDFDPERDFVKNEDGYPKIIERETWEAVQRVFEKNKYRKATNADIEYLLAGKVFCGVCGAQYIGQQVQSKKATYIYYKCGNQASYKNGRHKEPCKNNTVRKVDTEKYALSQIKKVIFNDKIIDDILGEYEDFANENVVNYSMIEMLQKEVKNIQEKIDNTLFAIQRHPMPTLIDALTQLEEQKKTAVDNLIEEQRNIGVLTTTREEIKLVYDKARKVLEQGTFDEQRSMINNYINKIIVLTDKVEVFINLVPNALLGLMDLEIRKQDFIRKVISDFASQCEHTQTTQVSQNTIEMPQEKTDINPSLPLAVGDNLYRQENLWLPR